MRYFVTGAAGFIGSHFVRELLAGTYDGVLPGEVSAVTVYDKLTYAGNLENLASVANDIAKRARSRPPGPGPSTTDARFAAGQALKRDDWNNPLTQPPQEAITQ